MRISPDSPIHRVFSATYAHSNSFVAFIFLGDSRQEVAPRRATHCDIIRRVGGTLLRTGVKNLAVLLVMMFFSAIVISGVADAYSVKPTGLVFFVSVLILAVALFCAASVPLRKGTASQRAVYALFTLVGVAFVSLVVSGIVRTAIEMSTLTAQDKQELVALGAFFIALWLLVCVVMLLWSGARGLCRAIAYLLRTEDVQRSMLLADLRAIIQAVKDKTCLMVEFR